MQRSTVFQRMGMVEGGGFIFKHFSATVSSVLWSAVLDQYSYHLDLFSLLLVMVFI